MRLWFLLYLSLLATPVMAAGDNQEDYLYFRELSIEPYQHLREFFDIPNRAGIYNITLLSESLGPLTFAVLRVSKEDDVETVVRQERSYHINNHEFQITFKNLKDTDDLLVEITNSNPLWAASVSVIVVEASE